MNLMFQYYGPGEDLGQVELSQQRGAWSRKLMDGYCGVKKEKNNIKWHDGSSIYNLSFHLSQRTVDQPLKGIHYCFS